MSLCKTEVEAIILDPENLQGLRARVNAESNGSYASFRNGLTPRYANVRRDIALGYLCLGATVSAVGVIGILAVPLGALLIGFFVAYLQLFLHEAAHYGLAAERSVNDGIADWLICWQVGTDIASYRSTHWKHHRSLGEADDTEISYRNRLSLRFIAEMLIGIHAVRVLLNRRNASTQSARKSYWPLLRGFASHIVILMALIAVGWRPAALAWLAGMAIFYPVFATLRQLLEHRPEAGERAPPAVTRLFGDDLFSRLFGGGGFNRHMLHHLEPQVSYTRLAELEDYLMGTSAKAELEARRSTYFGTFAALVRSDRLD